MELLVDSVFFVLLFVLVFVFSIYKQCKLGFGYTLGLCLATLHFSEKRLSRFECRKRHERFGKQKK